MTSSLERISKTENAELIKSEKTWWNGHAYHPLLHFGLRYNYLKGCISFSHEIRYSEFSKPSAVDGGGSGDRHLFRVVCHLKPITQACNFKISKRGFASRWLNRPDAVNFKIKCKNESLTIFLSQNCNLRKVFLQSENSPELSPLFEGKMENGIYAMTVRGNTQKCSDDLLLLINSFCKDIIEYYCKKK